MFLLCYLNGKGEIQLRVERNCGNCVFLLFRSRGFSNKTLPILVLSWFDFVSYMFPTGLICFSPHPPSWILLTIVWRTTEHTGLKGSCILNLVGFGETRVVCSTAITVAWRCTEYLPTNRSVALPLWVHRIDGTLSVEAHSTVVTLPPLELVVGSVVGTDERTDGRTEPSLLNGLHCTCSWHW